MLGHAGTCWDHTGWMLIPLKSGQIWSVLSRSRRKSAMGYVKSGKHVSEFKGQNKKPLDHVKRKLSMYDTMERIVKSHENQY